jgi:peptidoglycan/LPS O-acetylase OafA/YrhL
LLIAAITAGLVLLATRKRSVGAWPNSRLILGLGRVSYSLFLVHFPVCLLMNALGSRMFTTPLWAAVGLCTAFVASVAVAVPFHRFVEQRCRGGAATSSLSAVRHIVFRARLSTSDSG